MLVYVGGQETLYLCVFVAFTEPSLLVRRYSHEVGSQDSSAKVGGLCGSGRTHKLRHQIVVLGHLYAKIPNP